jgi:hypothetical protein
MLHIESTDDSERYDLDEGFSEVIAHLQFPKHIRLLCFLDDENDAKLVSILGPTNRGFHLGLKDYFAKPAYSRFPPLVAKVERLISFDVDGNPNYDNLVYLHGSTTKIRAAFIMTLAHELQHVLQHTNHYELWRDNTIMACERGNFGASYTNGPLEREAMLVSRQIATSICGRRDVADYIKQQNTTAQAELIRWSYQNDWNAHFLGLQEETEVEVKNHCIEFPNSSIKTPTVTQQTPAPTAAIGS